jgi:hypothetical protein
MVAGDGDREAVELFASDGYATVAPDYLGLGTGPGYHPYLDAASETTASIDMLDAAVAFADRRGRAFDPAILVTGFSQGGEAAMALGRALQDGNDDRWRLAAIAPISGPYDVQHAQLPGLLDHPGDSSGDVDPISGTFYIASWTVAMNRLHHLYSSSSQVFRAPYAATVEGLFDGNHDQDSVVAGLPGTPAELLRPQSLQALRSPRTENCWRLSTPATAPARGGRRHRCICTRPMATGTYPWRTPSIASNSWPPGVSTSP